MLCAVCISMFQTSLTEGSHHVNLRNIVSAADGGCKICKHLHRLLRDHGIEPSSGPQTDSSIRFQLEDGSDRETGLVMIRFLGSTTGVIRSFEHDRVDLHVSDPRVTPTWWHSHLEDIKRDLVEEPCHVRPDQFQRRNIAANTGAFEVMELAAEWLSVCEKDHPTCKSTLKIQEYGYCPPRLLDTGVADSKFCRLNVFGQETPIDNIRYVALSHCWGKNPSFLTLKMSNMKEFVQGILLDSLPRSFSDSIQVCRQLGFRYMWIDSLCIIQEGPGSEDDWQYHAATMDQIYANCTLNIAISHAKNAEQGAFVDRDADFLQTTSVYAPVHFGSALGRTSNHGSNSGDIIEQDQNNRGEISPTGNKYGNPDSVSFLITVFASEYDHKSALSLLPLENRGWVFQERIMAPRTLHFGKDRIYWECGQCFRNEYLPYGLPESGRDFDPHYQRAFSLPEAVLAGKVVDLNDSQAASLHSDWYHLVSDYSDTRLTYPVKDKFVAFTAIAKGFQKALREQYVAGFFRSTLVIGLLWHHWLLGASISRRADGWDSADHYWWERITWDPRRDPAYQAPSWSWASVNTGINIEHIRSAIGPLRGRHQSRNILAHIESINIELVDNRNPFGQLRSAELCLDGPVEAFNPPKKYEYPDPYTYSIRFEQFNKDSQLVALHVFEEYLLGDEGSAFPNIYGLILAPVGEGTYRRVGRFHCQGSPGSQYPASRFERATLKLV